MPKTAELGQILNGKWGKWDKWDRIHTHSYSADSVNPECLEDDPDERDAIQNEPEINLTEIPPMFDRRTPHMTQAST